MALCALVFAFALPIPTKPEQVDHRSVNHRSVDHRNLDHAFDVFQLWRVIFEQYTQATIYGEYVDIHASGVAPRADQGLAPCSHRADTVQEGILSKYCRQIEERSKQFRSADLDVAPLRDREQARRAEEAEQERTVQEGEDWPIVKNFRPQDRRTEESQQPAKAPTEPDARSVERASQPLQRLLRRRAHAKATAVLFLHGVDRWEWPTQADDFVTLLGWLFGEDCYPTDVRRTPRMPETYRVEIDLPRARVRSIEQRIRKYSARALEGEPIKMRWRMEGVNYVRDISVAASAAEAETIYTTLHHKRVRLVDAAPRST